MLRSRLRLTSSKLSSYGLACAEISSRQVPRKFAEKIFASARGEWARRSGATVSEDNKVQKQIGLCKPCVPLSTEGKDVKNYRDVASAHEELNKVLYMSLLTKGVFDAERGMFCMSTAMTKEDIRFGLDTLETSLREMLPAIAEEAPELI